MKETDEERERLEFRIIVCTVLALFWIGALVLRLWYVQVLQGSEHQLRMSRQSIRPVRINPVRGRIYCSDGELLVGNRCVYDLVFHLAEMRIPGKLSKKVEYVRGCASKLAMLIGRDETLTEKSIRIHMIQRPAMPMTVFQNLTEKECARLWELTPLMPGAEMIPRLVRDYPYPGILSQTLGFTGSIMPDEEKIAGPDYASSYVMKDLRGREGLELEYDKILSGSAGAQMLRVDPLGYAHQELPGTLAASDGCDLLLSIDSRAQLIGEEVMEGMKGALVLLDVNTGAVLALVSKPGFSLENLSVGRYRELSQDKENKPMMNRAVNAMYTPGSIVKPLVGLAALEAGVIDSEWRHNCIGYYQLGKTRIHCAKRYGGHGEMDIYDAITVSCNPFFIDIGCRTTVDRLSTMFSAAGFGKKTGVDFPEFAKGLCPSRDVAQQLYHRNWLAIDTAYCSMGQGLIQVTPLQVASYCAALANGGTLYRPYLVQEIRSQDGNLICRTEPEVRGHFPVQAENLEVIQTAMVNSVEDPSGSGHLLSQLVRKDPATGTEQRIFMASKTGTAELGKGENKTKDTWMINYGPLPEPKYALACVVEDGDSGSKTVAPIALEFWRRWLAEEQ